MDLGLLKEQLQTEKHRSELIMKHVLSDMEQTVATAEEAARKREEIETAYKGIIRAMESKMSGVEIARLKGGYYHLALECVAIKHHEYSRCVCVCVCVSRSYKTYTRLEQSSYLSIKSEPLSKTTTFTKDESLAGQGLPLYYTVHI